MKHRARPAARASTGSIQDRSLKHRARPAAQASTGLLQDKPLKHRALATQATVATPAQEHAQRAEQASTNLD
jgi:hypothetical protein